ncbi:MAG: DUF3995 domain-containing protein [Desulfobacteraceae bacterium]|nr:DUF3995 domain-containing protein [Desulfobacteraceae bacterium]
MQIISIALTIAFAIIAVFHVLWAVGYKLDIRNMVPVVNGEPVFTPGPVGTVLVSIVLCGFAGVSLGLGFPDSVPVNYLPFLKIVGIAIGVILLIRAIGDFKYAGFFKRIKGSNFAKYDSLLYSPFCLISGGALLYLATNLT